MTEPPLVSVVMATHQRSALLPRLVDALERQRFVGKFEVIIVDDGSPDDTQSVLAHLERTTSLDLTVLRTVRQSGPATARNLGCQRAAAAKIAFTDDDCVPQPDWLSTLVEAGERHDIVQGCTLPNPDQHGNYGPFSRTLAIRSQNTFVQTCNVLYDRALGESLGWFDEIFPGPAGEDTDLAHRALQAGATISFCEGALVFHDISPSSFRNAWRSVGRWEAIALVLRRHPALRSNLHAGLVWRRSHIGALAAMSGVVVSLARRSTSPAVVGGLSYAFVRLRWQRPRGRWATKVAVLPAFLALDCYETLVTLRGAIRHRTLVI